uniref:Uncharacterized protein n=1 Tax=Timema douglasi TaxID=61478 RepID=A0A7R8VK94_TIMDO|nr:unnamed protein product [Timema douglasi]
MQPISLCFRSGQQIMFSVGLAQSLPRQRSADRSSLWGLNEYNSSSNVFSTNVSPAVGDAAKRIICPQRDRVSDECVLGTQQVNVKDVSYVDRMCVSRVTKQTYKEHAVQIPQQVPDDLAAHPLLGQWSGRTHAARPLYIVAQAASLGAQILEPQTQKLPQRTRQLSFEEHLGQSTSESERLHSTRYQQLSASASGRLACLMITIQFPYMELVPLVCIGLSLAHVYLFYYNHVTEELLEDSHEHQPGRRTEDHDGYLILTLVSDVSVFVYVVPNLRKCYMSIVVARGVLSVVYGPHVDP